MNKISQAKWTNNWNINANSGIINDFKQFIPKSKLNRKNNTIITRLGIGHTRITHGHLMSKTDPIICSSCNVPQSVSHILTECINLQNFNPKLPVDLKSILTDSKNFQNVINYLKHYYLYDLI